MTGLAVETRMLAEHHSIRIQCGPIPRVNIPIRCRRIAVVFVAMLSSRVLVASQCAVRPYLARIASFCLSRLWSGSSLADAFDLARVTNLVLSPVCIKSQCIAYIFSLSALGQMFCRVVSGSYTNGTYVECCAK